ncbi:carcinoembryonic antigen-related cell adhesion molecule 20 isoform X2 [Sturnira hondurensis]|uniref:carcinoembryonic antigen-related cell adhesion molecule 20 isoform X2 n=1 Tax=Sturnira hondurensis TaxID=192404 RepID=UPI00187B0CB9|nr:carcinoembryonic antigen-related cell adhesion molecule 20 isoform X2 [Sturnira hondurensis]
MGPPGSGGPHWAGILLSASLLTMWSLPAATQLNLDANLLNISLRMPAKPSISVNPGVVTEHAGNVTFQCDTKDISPDIQWVFSNLPLVLNERTQLSSDGTVLTISPVLREDAGTYQCEAWDSQGSQSSELTYLVVNCESLSVPPNPLLTPTSWVFSFSHRALNTTQMRTCLPLNARCVMV